MFTKKEFIWLLIIVIIYEFIILFPSPNTLDPLILLIPILIIFTSVISKKIAAKFYHIEIEHKIWEFQRWGFYKRSHFKKPVQIGLMLPFALSILTLGMVKMFTFLQFEEKNVRQTRILKEHGLKRKDEVNDYDIAFTAAWGFFSLLMLALIGAMPGVNEIFPEMSKLAIYFGFWNMIPIGKLDGNKLFFGSILTWSTLAILYIIALILVII